MPEMSQFETKQPKIHPVETADTMIHITIKLFAVYQEAYGCAELHWQLPQGLTVGDLFDRVLTEQPQLEAWRSFTQFGVNCAFVSPETLLQEGDEVVLIPPVSGG